jgi:hypothetical protein
LGFGFWVLGFEFWVLGFGFWVLSFGFWVGGWGELFYVIVGVRRVGILGRWLILMTLGLYFNPKLVDGRFKKTNDLI